MLSLALSACGGDGGASDGDSRLDDKVNYPEQPSDNDSGASSSSSEPDSGASSSSSSEPKTDDDVDAGSSSSNSSVAGNDDEPNDTPAGSSSSSNSSSSSAPAEEDDVTDVSGTVRLEWVIPDQRENGDYLESFELGGYELRYREAGSGDYEAVILEDGNLWSHELKGLEGSYEFTIAAFDANGLYSEFVPLAPIIDNP